MATQKVNIEFQGTVNLQSVKNAANEMNKVIAKSSANGDVRRSSEKDLKTILAGVSEIDKILSKPKVTQNDLNKLKEIQSILDSGLKSLQTTMSSMGPAMTVQMQKVKEEIDLISTKAREAIAGLKAGFAQTTGTSFARSGAILKSYEDETEAAKQLLEQKKVDQLILAQQTVNDQQKIRSSELNNAKKEQQLLLDTYNKEYKSNLKTYEDFINKKVELAKKGNDKKAKEELAFLNRITKQTEAQQRIIEKNQPFTSVEVDKRVQNLVQKNTQKEQADYDRLTAKTDKYRLSIENTNTEINKINVSTQQETQSLDKKFATLEKKSLKDYNKDQAAANVLAAQAAAAQQLATKALEENQQTMIKASVKQKAFGKTLDALKSQFGRMISTYYIYTNAVQEFKKAISTVTELDKEITEIGIVTRQTGDEIWKTFEGFNKAAYNLSTTTKQYLEGAKIFYQQGMNTAEVMSMVDATTKAAALSGVDFRSASETLTASIKAYNMEASQALSVTDKFAAVGAASAADFRELSVAMEKVASQAYSSGMSFDSLLGILAKGIETTREAPEAIGTGLKSIIARFQEMKENPMTSLEDGVDANRVEKALRSIGVALRDTNGEFRNMDDVFADLGATWPNLTRNQRAYIATMAAGSRQQSRFMAIMNNYDRTLQLVRTSTNSAGEANAQYAIYEDSVEAAQLRLNNTMEKFYTQILSSDALKNIYDGLNNVMRVVSDLSPGFLMLASSLGIAWAKFTSFLVTAKIEAGMTLSQIAGKNVLAAKTYEWATSVVTGNNALKEEIVQQKLSTLATVEKSIAIEQEIIKNNVRVDGIAKAGKAEDVKTAKTKLASLETQRSTIATELDTDAKLKGAAANKAFALSMGAWIAIITVVIGLVIAFINYQKKMKQAIHETAAEQNKLAEEMKNQYTTLDTQIERYEQLSKVVNKTQEEQAEYNDIIKQILDTHPGLIDGIDAEGNARLKNTESLKEYTKELQRNSIEQQRNAYVSDLASKKASEWNATLQEGAVSQRVADLASSYEATVKNSLEAVSKLDATGQASQMFGALKYAVEVEFLKTGTEITQADRDRIIKNQLISLYGENYAQDFAKETKAYTDEANRVFSAAVRYQETKIIDTAAFVKKGLYAMGQSELDLLEQQGIEVSNQFRDVVSQFASFSVEEALLNKKKTVEEISAFSETLQAELLGGLTDLQKIPGFDTVLEDMFNMKKTNKTMNEIKNSFESFSTRFEIKGNLSKALLDQFAGINEFESVMNDFKGILGIALEEDIPDTVRTTMENLAPTINNAIYSAINQLETIDQKKAFINAIDNIFANNELKTRYQEQLENSFADPEAVRLLTEDMIKAIELEVGDIEIAKAIVESLIESSNAGVEAFLINAKDTYDALKKIQDKMKEPMDFGEGMEAIKTYGVENVISVGTGFTMDPAYVENERLKAQEKMKASINAIIADLQNQKKVLLETKNVDKDIVKAIDLEIEGYQQLKENISGIKELEDKRLENMLVTKDLAIMDTTNDKMKTYAEIIDKIDTGKLTENDIFDYYTQNPELMAAIDRTNGSYTFRRDILMQIAEETRKEGIQAIELENKKFRAQIDSLKAYIDYMKTKSIAEQNAIDLSKAEEVQIAQNELQAAIAAKQQVENNYKVAQSSIDVAKANLTQLETIIAIQKNSKTFNSEMQRVYDEAEKSVSAYSNTIKNYSIDISNANTRIATAEQKLKESLAADTFKDLGINPKTVAEAEAQLVKLEEAYKKGLATEEIAKNRKAASMLKSVLNDTGKEAEKTTDSLEKFYNLLEKINDLESDLSAIQNRVDLRETSAEDDIKLTEEKAQKLNQLIFLQKTLTEQRRKELVNQELEVQKYNDLIYLENGLAMIRQKSLSSMLNSGQITQEYYDDVVKTAEAYNKLSGEIEDSEDAVVSLKKQQEEMYDDLINKAIDTRQKIYDALVEADQKELDQLTEKYDKMKELEDDYLGAVKNAIDEARQAREDADKDADLAAKKRQLSILQRDTSGLYSTETAKLQQEIATAEQEARDTQIDRQFEALEKQITVAQEQRDTQVKLLEEQMQFRQETGYYWDRVDDAIQNGPKAMVDLLTSTQEYQTADPLVQTQQLEQFNYATEQLSALIAGDGNKNVIEAIMNAARAIIENNIEEAKKAAEEAASSTSGEGGAGGSNVNVGDSTERGATPSTTGSDSIRALQSFLNTYFNAGLKVDGLPGPKTEAATDSMLNKMISKAMDYYGANSGYFLSTQGALLDSINNDKINSTAYSFIKKMFPGAHASMNGLKYKKGGVVDFTGPAWVDGTKSSPEAFLNAKQTEIFAQLRDFLTGSYSLGMIGQTSNSSSTVIGDIVINLQNATNASAEQIAALVKKDIMNSIQNRVSMGIQNVR